MTGSGAPKSPSKKKGEDTESKINDILENVGQAVKMDVDCSKIVEEKIPEAKKLAKDKKLNEALDLLLNLEKQTRTGSDMHSTSKVLVAIVQLCYEVINVAKLVTQDVFMFLTYVWSFHYKTSIKLL